MSPQTRLIQGFYTLGLLFCILFTPVAGLEAKVFGPHSFTLENGLQVIVVPNHRAPVVSHMIWYKVGAADEPYGKSGLAHFFEHLMFKGTKNTAPGAFSDAVARHGGEENAFTSQDFTAYHQTVAKDQLALMMKFEADRMTNLVLTPEIIEPERKVVLEERNGKIGTNPAARLREMANASLFLHHPYGVPVLGWAHEVAALSLEDFQNFYRTWYTPSNAMVIVVGDVDPQEVKQLAETYYGPIENHSEPVRRSVQEPQHWAPRTVELADETVRQPRYSIEYLIPGTSRRDLEQEAALEVLMELMTGTTGRLYRNLVVDQPIAVSAGAYFDSMKRDMSTISFWILPRQNVPLQKAKEAMHHELDKLLSDGVTQSEVQEAKDRLINEAVYARDDIKTPAYVIGISLATGYSIEDIESWPDRLSAVTTQDVIQAARNSLVRQNSVESVLMPVADNAQTAVREDIKGQSE